MSKELSQLIARAEAVLERVELMLPPKVADPDWKRITAARASRSPTGSARGS